MAFALEHFPTFPYPPSGMREVVEVERYLTSLHRSMQEFFSLLPRDIKDGISVVDLDDLANTTLSDPNADRIVFWDDGAGVYTWLTANTGLAISTTNLNLSHLGIESLADPGADRIFFWDDGETASKWLAPNNFLTISGTDLNVDYVDEDDMVSNSATLLPTQQSVKAYVDNSIHSLIELYLTDTADGDVATYLVMDDVETGQGESSVVLENMGTGDDQEIEQWVTPLGGLGAHTLVAGVYNLHIHAERTDGGRTVQLYWELWTRLAGGAETLRGTSEVTGAVTSKADFNPHLVISSDVDINTTDRIVIKVYANAGATPANDTDITLYMEGSVESHLRMPTPFSTISNIFVRHDLATAANDFLVASGANAFVKQTLAATGAILEADIQHDNLQGVTAAEHLDWTGASSAFLTSGTLGCGDLTTTKLIVSDGTPEVRLYESDAGTDQKYTEWHAAAGVFQWRFVDDAYMAYDTLMTVYRNTGTYTVDRIELAADVRLGVGTGTGELTCGSINRASGNLSLEVGGTAAFLIESGAGANTLVVDSNSRLGIGLASPSYDGHVYKSGADVAFAVERDSGALNFINATATFGNFGTVNDFPVRINVNGTWRVRFNNDNNMGMRVAVFGTSANTVFGIKSGTAPSTSPSDTAQMWVEDIAAAAGEAGFHIRTESSGESLILPGVSRKTTTGDPAGSFEGMMCINTFDNNFKVYAEGAWRQLVAW